MHIALGGIISQNAIDRDSHQSISKPAIRAVPRLGLNNGWMHHKVGSEPYQERDKSLQEEQPASSGPSSHPP